MEKRSRVVQQLEGTCSSMNTHFSPEEHKKVLERCLDVPEAAPSIPLPINMVGISEKTVWIRLPQGLIPFECEIFVDLPKEYKGIHMSRMEQAISELYHQDFEDLNQYCHRLARLILKGQRAKMAKVKVWGKLPQLFRSQISQKDSTDFVHVFSHVTLSANKAADKNDKKESKSIKKRCKAGIGAYHITACPCTQVYNKELFGDNSQIPYPTHSQRCLTWLEIETTDEPPSFSSLFECLASCLHLSQDLLKRPDEAELVLRCHLEPQFAEDVVRAVAMEAGKAFKNGNFGPETVVRIKTTSFESIHRHNVQCLLETPLKDLPSEG